MKKFTVLVLAIIFSLYDLPCAFAANWVELSRNADVITSVDATSIQYNSGIIQVWEKFAYRNESSETAKILKEHCKKTVAYSMQYTEYDVSNRLYRIQETILYDKSSNVVLNEKEEGKWSRIPPSTIIDDNFNVYKTVLKIK